MKRSYVFLALLALVVGGSFLAFRWTRFATLDLGKGYAMHFYERRVNEFDIVLEDLPAPANSYFLDYELRRDSRVLWKRRLSWMFNPPRLYRF